MVASEVCRVTVLILHCNKNDHHDFLSHSLNFQQVKKILILKNLKSVSKKIIIAITCHIWKN